jgi:bla regulator protein blaR1
MTAFGESIVLQALGWALLNSLWQMALLWVIYHLILSVSKNAGPHQKSLLASIVLFSGFSWFIITFLTIWVSDSSVNHSLVTSSMISVDGNERLNQWLQSTLPLASLIYLVLLIIPAISFARNYRYVHELRINGITKVDVKWRMFIKRVSEQMGIKKPVHIWISDLITSPVTIGFLKPIILVPLAAVNNLTPQQLEAVLLHELSHIKRHDYLINLVITLIRTILYFNPFVKLFIKTIEREREKSCDEIVIQFQYDPYGYAAALLELEKNNFNSRPMVIASTGRKTDLLHRIERILGIEKKPFISFNRLAGLFAGLLCVIALNALLILSKPVNHTNSISLNQFGNPFYFFLSDEESAPEQTVKPTTFLARADKEKTVIIRNEIKKEYKLNNPVDTNNGFYNPSPFTQVSLLNNGAEETHPAFIHANLLTKETPQLKKYQEEQVSEAVEMTKKVLKEKEWKTIENNIADAMTAIEKNELRTEYMKELGQVNWNKLQEQLRFSYNKINWDQIGDQLSKAIIDIKLDSIQNVYTTTVTELHKLECMVAENKAVTVVPDSDITLEKVKEKKLHTITELNKVKAVRTKKIVHL